MYQKILSQYGNWLRNYENFSPATQKKYLRQIEQFLNYLEAFQIFSLNDLASDTIARFLKRSDQRAYSASWMRVRNASLHLFFRWAYEHRFCSLQPMIRYRREKIVHQKLNKETSLTSPSFTILSMKEQEQLYRYLQTLDSSDILNVRNRSLILLLLASGLYAEEVIALQANELFLKKGTLIARANPQRLRIVSFDTHWCKQSCLEWLKLRKKLLQDIEQPFLYFTFQYQPLRPRTLYKIVADTLDKAGIKKSHGGPNLLRQTALCNRLKKNESLEVIRHNFGIETLSHIEDYRYALAIL